MGYFNGKIGNAHAPCHVTSHQNHLFGISVPNLLIHYITYETTTTFKGSLHGSTPIVKRFSAEKSRQKRAQNGGFSGIRGFKC